MAFPRLSWVPEKELDGLARTQMRTHYDEVHTDWSSFKDIDRAP